jgi:hypothetical protein
MYLILHIVSISILYRFPRYQILNSAYLFDVQLCDLFRLSLLFSPAFLLPAPCLPASHARLTPKAALVRSRARWAGHTVNQVLTYAPSQLNSPLIEFPIPTPYVQTSSLLNYMYQGKDGGVDTTHSVIFPDASYKLITSCACKIPELKLNCYDQASIMFELPPIPIAFTLRALHIYSLAYLEPQ